MLRRVLVGMTPLVVGAFPAIAQRASDRIAEADVKVILKSDSARFSHANVSPDGKWLVFARSDDAGNTSSIWIASMNNPKPIRLTTDGYRDIWPTVSPTGDRVFFISNRANRDPSSAATFVMSMPIEKNTGKPTGPFRQVSMDTVTVLPPRAVSPDGKWLTYTPRSLPLSLRLAPANGGNSRALTPVRNALALGEVFTPDGKAIVFQDSNARLLKKVDVASGAVTTIRRSSEGMMPISRPDGRYLAMDLTPPVYSYDLRDDSGRLLGTARMPSTYAQGQGSFAPRADEKGIVGARNDQWFVLKRAQLADGQGPTLAGANAVNLTTGTARPIAITSSGDVLSQRTENGRIVLAVQSMDGKRSRDVAISPDVVKILGALRGGKLLLGRGKANADSTTAAYLIDPSTGNSRLLSRAALPWSRSYPSCCFADGEEGDGGTVVGFAERHGTSADIKSIDDNGATHLLRSFALGDFRRMWPTSIQGAMVAWVDTVGKNEIGVFVTMNATGAPVRVATLSGVNPNIDVAVQWSPSGRKLAVAYPDGEGGMARPDLEKSSPTRVLVVDVGPDGASHGSTKLDAGIFADYMVLAWAADETEVYLIKDDPMHGHDDMLIRRPLDPNRQAIVVAPIDERPGDMLLSPDRRSLFYSVKVQHGASIWTAEWAPRK
jgi:Tol biopolymer transport system component